VSSSGSDRLGFQQSPRPRRPSRAGQRSRGLRQRLGYWRPYVSRFVRRSTAREVSDRAARRSRTVTASRRSWASRRAAVSDIGILGAFPSAMRSSEAAASESRAASGGFFGRPDDIGRILPARVGASPARSEPSTAVCECDRPKNQTDPVLAPSVYDHQWWSDHSQGSKNNPQRSPRLSN